MYNCVTLLKVNLLMLRPMLIELHWVFQRQAIYPLILASGLCVVLFTMRVFYSGRFLEYRNLVWNLALAWIPYILSFSIAATYTVLQRRWWFLLPVPGIAWLL